MSRIAAIALLISVGLLCGCPPRDDGETALISDASAEFDETKIIAGYTKPARKSRVLSKKTTLKVNPANAVNQVKLRKKGQSGRFKIVGEKRDAARGVIEFQVKGMSATAKKKPNGDAFIEARLAGQTLARAAVVVVVPKAIATPHDTFTETLSPVNRTLDRTTSPAFFGALPRGHVVLSTLYIKNLNVAVNDQFGARLDAIYAGAPVVETMQGRRIPINQAVNAQGVYLDPVGFIAFVKPSVPAKIRRGGATIDNPAIAAFLRGPPRPPKADSANQNIPVRVGGHKLNPGVRNRTVKTEVVRVANEVRARVTVTWPDN